MSGVFVGFSPLPSLFRWSLTEPEITVLARLAREPLYPVHIVHLGFDMDSGNPSEGPYACRADTLLIEPSPQPCVHTL